MFRFKSRKKIYVVRSPGSAFFDEARFVLKEGAGRLPPGRCERELAREAEKIIAEYGLFPFPGKAQDAGLTRARKKERKSVLWYFAGILTAAALFLLAGLVFRIGM